MKLHEEFKLYENMWESIEIEDSSNVYEDLRVKLIDEFNVKGFTQEVAILENCTLSASPYDDLVIALKDTKDVLYIHPELTKPENFDKACVAVRVELAYPILGIKITDPKNIVEVKKALDAIKARLTSKEVNVAKNFILANKHYTCLEVGTSHRTKQIVYVLSTFDGDEYVYDNFYKAVDDAENKYCTEANSVYPYYLNDDGTYTEMVPDGVEGCLCWTEEEGIIEEALTENLQENSNLNTHRIMKMYCVEISDDGSEFELRFEVNGKTVDRVTVYSFDDVLIVSAEFFKRNCEKVSFDTRFDRLEIKLDYTYYGA